MKKEKFERLVFDLKYSNLSDVELGLLYGVSDRLIREINNGRSCRRDYLDYPIRQMVFSNNNETYESIQKDLISTNIDYDNLAIKYDCSVESIRRINLGESWFNEKLKYPLRSFGKLSSADIYGIHNLLLEDKMSINDIAKKYNVTDAIIKRINSGKTNKYVDERFTYPLRT